MLGHVETLDSLLCVGCRRHATAAASCLGMGATCVREEYGRHGRHRLHRCAECKESRSLGLLPMLCKDKPVERIHTLERQNVIRLQAMNPVCIYVGVGQVASGGS